MFDKKITAAFIIEILGRPAEHIKQTITELIEKLCKEKGINVIEKTIHEPKKIEEKQGEDVEEKPGEKKQINEEQELFTSFAEVEAEFDELRDLLNVMFDYMPSNIEIINPKELTLKSLEISELLTAVNLKLHKYDEIAKTLISDRTILINKLKEMGVEIKQAGKGQPTEDNKI